MVASKKSAINGDPLTALFLLEAVDVCLIILNYSGRKAKRIPAATAEPITPATLGPIACIKRKLPGLYC